MRQCGKTTLARDFVAVHRRTVHYFDLEDPRQLARFEDPMLTLEPLRGLVVLDEVQRLPDVFPVLRVLADRPRCPARFLVLGSASPELLRQTSESLAGRISYLEMRGFTLDEVGSSHLGRLWLRGSFPPSYLASTQAKSLGWRDDFILTFLERDLGQIGTSIASASLRRFWNMLAHYHGQIWNASAFARSFGVSHSTIRRYLDLLTSTFAVVQLPPWHENIKKRQVRAPKVYLSDSGILHALLGLASLHDLEGHPKVGASWEGFLLFQIIHRLGARPRECHFWATHAGAELDLVVVRGRRRLGFEIKRTVSPKTTPSTKNSLTDLGLTRLDVVHGGHETYPLARNVRALAASRILEDLQPIR